MRRNKETFLPALCAGMRRLWSFLDAAPAHTPRPSSRACRGRLSPGRCLQVRLEPQRAVYTPHACPSPRAHVVQQPQPGSLTVSAQSFGSGLHWSSAPASHGSHRTTGPTEPASRVTAASATARQSAQRAGMAVLRKGRCASRRAGSGGLSVTQRAGQPSPSVLCFCADVSFYKGGGEKERGNKSHLLRMNNVSGEPRHEGPLRPQSGGRGARALRRSSQREEREGAFWSLLAAIHFI